MTLWKRYAEGIFHKKSAPVEDNSITPYDAQDEHDHHVAQANALSSFDRKNFDWNHYRTIQSGYGQGMFSSEFDFFPTMAVMKSLIIQEPWINFCVNAIVKQFLGPRFLLKYSRETDGEEEKTYKKHPFLSYMSNAGSDVEGSAVFTANATSDLITTGNAYWWTSKDLKTKRRIAAEKIEPIVVNNRITEYRILQRDNETFDQVGLRLTPDEITHIKLTNPFSPHIGLSMIIATVLPVLIDKYGREYVVGFFLRGGNTSGIIETDKTDMTQLLKFQKTLMQALGGRKNMHSDKILPKGAVWKGQGNNFASMQLVEMLKDNLSNFRAATGCTNTVLGIADNINRATAFAEMEHFWISTILPLQKLYCEGIKNSSLWKRFGLDENWHLEFDNSKVVYLDDFERRLDQDSKLAATLTINERRARLGADPLEGKDKLASELTQTQTPFLNFSLPGQPAQPALAIDEPAIQIEAGNGDDHLGKWKAEEEQIVDPGEPVVDFFSKEFKFWADVVIKNIDDKDAALKQIQSRKDRFAKALADKVKPFALRAYDNQLGQATDAKAVGAVVTKENEVDRKAKLDALRQRAKDVISGNILENAARSFEGYTDTAMIDAYSLISERLEAGDSIDAIASQIRQRFGETYAGQSNSIVRTEYGAAISIAQAQFGEDLSTVTKVMRKDWVTMGDEHTRATHLEAEGSPIEGDSKDIMDYAFPNGLRYPRDPEGEAGEVINCRCTVRYVPVEWK